MNIPGKLGWAQSLPVEPKTVDETASLGHYYVHLDQPQHPVWRDYAITLIHLRPIEGESRPAERLYNGAEYELMVLVLDPTEKPNPNDRDSLQYLLPQNVRVQFHLDNDDGKAKEMLKLATVAILDGTLPAETSGIRGAHRAWESSLAKTAEHLREGEHHEH